VKRMSLDTADATVREFVHRVAEAREPVILEMDGEEILQAAPPRTSLIDREELKAAILARRDESRRLNDEWEAVDREVWEASEAGG
jgi:hypothetical protein